MDFLKFFGLKEDPFKLTPDPSYFYPSSSHNEGLLLMDYSIDQKEGFLLVIGDPGTGKTTLLNVFLEKWKSRAEIAIILTPRLWPVEFLRAVAEDFNINITHKDKHETIRALRDFMSSRTAEGKRVIIIVDEAQNLPDDTMEELRLLSNLETDKDKLLQIILLGQPELESKLMKKNLRQLNQRISTRIGLKHFNPGETLDYINFRIIKAGKNTLRLHKKAGRSVHRLTNGVPRLINMLLSRALMAAYLEESSHVRTRHIEHAVKSLNHSDLKIEGRIRHAPLFGASIAVVLVMLLMYAYFQKSDVWRSVQFKAPPASEDVVENEPLPAPAAEAAEGAIQETETVDMDVSDHPAGDRGQAEHDIMRAADLRLASVQVDVAFLRTRPSIDAKKAGTTLRGNQLFVLHESLDERGIRWYQVVFQGEKRWISGEVVDIVGIVREAGYSILPEGDHADPAENTMDTVQTELHGGVNGIPAE